MSGLVSTAGLGASSKLVGLTKHTRHKHIPSPVAPGFVAPPVQQSLAFKPIALAAAIARTATTFEDAPAELLDGLQQSALIELDTMLEGGNSFALKSHFKFVADTAGSQFAAKVGAGIAHLYMDALGYAWRANAICLSSSLDPHADFIYDGGKVAGHGVVLAEAHGSFAKQVTAAKIESAAKRKYIKQVKGYVAKPSPFGKIIHGYSIAFGAKPTSVGSFLAMSETRISKPRKRTALTHAVEHGSPLVGVPTAIALTTHRSNFLLVDVPEVVKWIDWLRLPDAAQPDRQEVALVRLQYAGRSYLSSMHWPWRPDILHRWIEYFFDHPDWHHIARRRLWASRGSGIGLGWFAIEEKAGLEFLNILSVAIRTGERAVPTSLNLPNFEPVGFGLSEDADAPVGSEEGGYQYALFRDGLAFLGDPFRGRPLDIVVWSPGEDIALK